MDVRAVLAEAGITIGKDGYVSVTDLARAAGRNPSTIQRWFDAGHLAGHRLAGGQQRRGPRRITPESAAKLLTEQ